jgi:hypothetical protein
MTPALVNLIVYQGATFDRALQFMHAVALQRHLMPGQDKIYTTPLSQALLSGYTLIFLSGGGEATDLTITQAAGIGDEQLSIAPYQGTRLNKGSVAETFPQDLTGQQYRGHIRKTANSADILAQFTFTATPLDGLVRLSLSAAVTANLPANCNYYDLPIGGDLSSQGGFGGAAWESAYHFDIESELGAVVERRAYGRVWVPREVTR